MASDEGVAVRAIVVGIPARVATVRHTDARPAAENEQQQCNDVRLGGGVVLNACLHLGSTRWADQGAGFRANGWRSRNDDGGLLHFGIASLLSLVSGTS